MLASFLQASFKTLKGCRTLAQVSLGQRQRATGKDCEGGGGGWSNKSHKGRCVCNHGSVIFFVLLFFGGVSFDS